MLSLLAAILFQTSVTIRTGKADTTRHRTPAEIRRDSIRAARRDSIRAVIDSSREARAKRPPRRDSVTPAMLASAFDSPRTRELLERARAARMRQDSSLDSYDAKTYQRLSVGLGLKRFGRDRLLFRHESAARVRWKRDVGAWIDVTGKRTVVPAFVSAQGDVDEDPDNEISPIPYFPGRDQLWVVGGEVAKNEVDTRELVHPLAVGAEAYYRYSVGDSITYTLPDGTRIPFVEMLVTARRPKWNLVVGSFWFDAGTAQLARAAYRLSVPMDIRQVVKEEAEAELRETGKRDEDDDIPRWLGTMTANISAITIEFGLNIGSHGERWWLPRSQRAQGEVQVAFMHVPMVIEQSFRYASVNGTTPVPPIPSCRTDSTAQDSTARDSTVRDSTARDSTARDSTARRRKREVIDEDTATVRAARRSGMGMCVAIRTPKDTARLARSPDLPPSAYEPGEQLFGTKEAEELEKELGFGLQAGWAPQRPRWHYGLERYAAGTPFEQPLVRYNRVEGFSIGASVDEEFGRGYAAAAMLRIGTADGKLNGEAMARRSDGRRTVGLGGYRRLAVAGDWGDPLSLGPSLNALLFARDDGLYYRTRGAELTGLVERAAGSSFSWRVFGEQHGDARTHTQLSLAHAIDKDHRFDAPDIDAREGRVAGVGLRLRNSFGLDPHGFRLLSDLRAEGAGGDFGYGRAMFDETLSHGLGPWLDGALTLSAGSSLGALPPQRLWYLGGSQSVRGQPAGAAAGTAFWMARAELGSSFVGARPVIFYDLGWAGARGDWRTPGRPLSGAGLGFSFLDGLVRFDIAKGLNPKRSGARVDLYVESRF